MQMTFDLTNPIFTNEEAARRHFESVVWPTGPVCPHCGVIGNATELRGESTRPGLYKCKDCRKPFTATIGTLYERSHIPLNKWLLATHLMCASKKGMSAHQLWRMLGFGSYKTAWFMCHRIREGMRESKLPGSMGGEGKFVEADETFVGGRAKNRAYNEPPAKEAVMALVECEGTVRSFHLRTANVTPDTVKPIIAEVLSTDSHFRTDESGIYWKIGEGFAAPCWPSRASLASG
jgi:transposase-like protein